MFDEPDPALFEVLGECKVRTRCKHAACSNYAVVEAWPEEPPPAAMTKASCWCKDHWVFDNGVPSSVLAVYDTWVNTGVDTWADWSYCLLVLQNRGFLFKKWDRSLVEQGAGI